VVQNKSSGNWGTTNGREPDNCTYPGLCNNDQDAIGIALSSWPHGKAGEWNDIQNTELLYSIVEINTTTGINLFESQQEENSIFYPNPSTGILYLRFVCKTVKIYNINGQLCKSFENTRIIDISELKQGIYIAHISGNTKTVAKKIIVN
ncbi:MAG: T9SS type A sorting domain-containing protein, partial [Draconibacterium sp.]|nr:T9SS type A sorting domain-containing protein [Draconibacterium sp.]